MSYARGANRERQFGKKLEADGYSVTRSAGSHSPWDLVAVCPANSGAPQVAQVLYVQVKADRRGPFSNFGPEERRLLVLEAKAAGAVPVLVHWPAGEQPRWYYEHEWPEGRNLTR